LDTCKLPLTVLKRQSANDVPTDPAHINPANLYPRFTFAGLGAAEEVYEFYVGHTSEAAANTRVVCDFDETVLSDVSEIEIGGVLADVDARFCARAFA
jgi:hypothetical protein